MPKKVFFLFTLLLFSFQISGQQTSTAPKIVDSRGNDKAAIDCSYPLNGNCLELQVKDVPVLSETTSYKVSSILYAPAAAFTAGTKLNANVDDNFINKLTLPFNFCYFGNSYKEVVVSSNGFITFGDAVIGSNSYPNVASSNPSLSLPKNSIFGVYSDLLFSQNEDSEIYYAVIGTAPARKFVLSFYRGTIVGCEGYTSTTQIVLSEGTNSVDIFVENKPAPCSGVKFKNSLLGIINADGTLGYSPANRNTGVWSAQKEAWRFTPDGTPVVPILSWYNSANEKIGGGEKISVCPEKNEIYTVKIEYPVCGTAANILQDEFPVTFAAGFPVLKDYTNVFCGGTSQVVNLDDYAKNLTTQNPADFNFTFYSSPTDAQNGTNPIPKTYNVINTPVYVRAENKSDPSCFQTAVLNLSLISTSLLTDKVYLCDINNDGFENNVDLTILNDQLFTLPINGKLRYFLSNSDAESNTNEVSRANLSSTTQLFVKYETTTCSHIFGPITVNFLSSPPVPAPFDYPITRCDELSDGAEPFDFLLNLGPLIKAGGANAGAKLTFYENQNDAYAGVTSNLKTIHEGDYPIYVRIQNPGETCFSIAVVNLKVIFNKVLATNAAKDVCFNGTTRVVSINLDTYSATMLDSGQNGITTEYYATFKNAVDRVNPISPNQNVTVDTNFVTKVFYVRFTDPTGCYALKTLELNLINTRISPTAVVCDVNLDQQETVTLANLDRQIIGSQKAEVTYFGTAQEANDNVNPLTTKVITTGANKVFVRVVSTCAVTIQEINITLGETPVVVNSVTPTIGTICDNNNDGKEPFDITQFQSDIYKGTDEMTFQYYTAYTAATNTLSGFIANPTAYPVAKSSVVYVKVINKGGCFSVSTLNLNIEFKPVIRLNQNTEALKKCDFQNDANETFNLKDAIPQLFTAASNTYSLDQLTVTFYRTKADADAGLPSKQISSNYTTSTNGTTTLFARFTSNTQACYSVAPIKLQIAFPPKGQNSQIPNLCDNNLDGLYEADLTLYTSNLVLATNIDLKSFNFKFFKTLAEAQNLNSTPIPNPTNFTFPSTLTRIYVRIENAPGCFDVVYIDLKFGQKAPLNKVTFPAICDTGNDNSESVDLTSMQTNIYSSTATFEYYETLEDLYAGNKISSPTAYTFKGTSKKIFVKVIASGFCAEKTEINLSLKKTPMFTIADQFFCLQEPANIQPNFSGLNITKFEWIDPSGKVVGTEDKLLNVKVGGLYKINVTSANGCTYSTEFNVKSYPVPVINSVILNGKIFTVNASGDKPILYSSDGVKFQASNLFNADNLPFGVNTFYVKFENSACIGEPKSGLKLQNAFTPNGDGINDTWVIDQLDLFNGEKLNLKVFNRYQEKIFEQESPTRLEWDGKNLSRVVATDSYWYVLTLPDGTIYTGWVLLKNRN